MRLRSLRTLSVLGLLALAACNTSPMAGDACSKNGFECQDEAVALECVAGEWVALQCRGPGGCNRTDTTVDCDMSANQVGDACATTVEGDGLCAADGKALYECRNRKLVKTQDCSTCEVQSGQLVCNP